MAKSSYKGRGYGRGYKVSNVLEAFKKMPEYRRGFKTEALWGGGKVKKELGNPQKKISGKSLVNYLKKKRGFSYDKIETFFKSLSTTDAPKQKPAIPSFEKMGETQKLPPEKVPQKEWRPAEKIKPEEKQMPPNERPGIKPAQWMKEIGRQRIKFEKERPDVLAGQTSYKTITKKTGGLKPESKQLKGSTLKTHEEIIQEEKARRTEYEETQKQNIQKTEELDKKETEKENQVGKIMNEEFGSQDAEPKT
jgi:hypothetical protein